MVSERMLGLGTARSSIRELFEYGKCYSAEHGPDSVFDFSIGNPSVPVPVAVNETAIMRLQTDPNVHCYTSAQGDFVVRQRFADSLNRRFCENYSPDNFYITAGAAAGLCCIFAGLTCPNDEFIVFAPCFPEYQVFIENAHAHMITVPADTESFQLNLSALEQLISPRTKGIVINSPNNPTGVVYTRETLIQLASILTKKSCEYGHAIYLISDEPYREIVFSGVEQAWLPHIYPDTLVCYSFSKALSLPGERIGYVLVPPSVTDSSNVYAAIIGAGRSLGYVNAPSLFQHVVSQCCDMTADLTVYERNSHRLVSALREAGYQVVEPGGAFYLFPRCPEHDDYAFSERAKQYGLLLVPGSAFATPGYFRLSYCVQPEMIERAIPKFKLLAESYARSSTV